MAKKSSKKAEAAAPAAPAPAKCFNCGAKVDPEDAFCWSCGKNPRGLLCPYCGETCVPTPDGFAFCSKGHAYAPANELHPNGSWFPEANDPAYEHAGGTIYFGKEDANAGKPNLKAMSYYRWKRGA